MMNVIQNLKLPKKAIWDFKVQLPFKTEAEKPNPKWKSKKKVYTLTLADMKTFSVSGMQFLTFDEFLNIIKWYRDGFYAGMNVANFPKDVGVKYNVWTRYTESTYNRNIIFDEIIGEIYLSFEIPNLDKYGTFPLLIKLYDEDGNYLVHYQDLAIQRFHKDHFITTSWARVPEIREFLQSQCEKE